MLNKELSQFAESSKSGTQISKFLINTYMEDREGEEEEGVSENLSRQNRTSGGSGMDLLNTPVKFFYYIKSL